MNLPLVTVARAGAILRGQSQWDSPRAELMSKVFACAFLSLWLAFYYSSYLLHDVTLRSTLELAVPFYTSRQCSI